MLESQANSIQSTCTNFSNYPSYHNHNQNHNRNHNPLQNPINFQNPANNLASTSFHQSHSHIQALLSKQLGPEFLATRPGAGGSKLTYIEGWRVIALANEIFGFDGWSSETKSIQVDFVDESTEGRFNVGVSAIVRIWLKSGGSHEDVGYGKLENCKSKADALDKCKKEAVTDALKRAMRTFGNLMGNCLYDKSYLNNIKNMQAQKEKFLPSKLYRPQHVQKPNDSNQVKTPINQPIDTSVDSKLCSEFAMPLPKVLPTYSKPDTKSTISPHHRAAKRPDTFPPAASKTIPKHQLKVVKEDCQAQSHEIIKALPPTLSDDYFDLNEEDLAQLDTSEYFGQGPGEIGSPDESEMVTCDSIQIGETCENDLLIRPESRSNSSSTKIGLMTGYGKDTKQGFSSSKVSNQFHPKSVTTNDDTFKHGQIKPNSNIIQAGKLPDIRAGTAIVMANQDSSVSYKAASKANPSDSLLPNRSASHLATFTKEDFSKFNGIISNRSNNNFQHNVIKSINFVNSNDFNQNQLSHQRRPLSELVDQSGSFLNTVKKVKTSE
ncbi:hypothetical protein O181_018188 [Austropuccinia psidii MF-1]|uniref:DNA repair and recombination protein RAD52 n=1 Tax=Austropuccinia psidii MF-1 TaxID=1389203 RepID=A0A9Q3C7G9_9BASI|nr:hypothetical protein [Austropuccinia psidii MF-1]